MGEGVATVDPVEAAPVDGTEAPGEVTDPAAPTDGTTAPTDGTAVETGPVVLPQNITGQSAATQTCSQGRTQY